MFDCIVYNKQYDFAIVYGLAAECSVDHFVMWVVPMSDGTIEIV